VGCIDGKEVMGLIEDSGNEIATSIIYIEKPQEIKTG
jgi:hypothetical protein